ncbi:MAG: MerR family transcriptional regulator [Chloroflexota bacterium]
MQDEGKIGAVEGADSAGLGPTYSLAEAARIAGISPSAIRLYEKEGLLRLQRTPGGHRYLTEEDLNVLRHIRVLRRSQGLKLGAVRRELLRAGQISATEAAEHGPAMDRPGPRIRALRQQRGVTLKELADKTGLSVSFLSSFERGLTGVSVANLQRIIDVCGSSLIDVFGGGGEQPQKLVRAKDRPRLTLNHGDIVIEDLVVVPRQIEIQMWTIQPGAGSEDAYSHRGEEGMYLLSGSLEVQLNEAEFYTLLPGDCLYFASSDLHRWRNSGSEPAVVLWVNTPPTF